MQMLQTRLLRGPNLYAPVPCLMVLVDAGPQPIVAGLAATPDSDGNAVPVQGEPGRVIASTTLALQRLCGDNPAFYCALPAAGKPRQHRVVIEYAIEHVAQAALRLALELITHATGGQPFPLSERIAALQSHARHFRLSDAAAQAVELARAQRLPVLRVSEHADLIQLGTGRRQVRFAHDVHGDTALLSRFVSGDRALSRILLSEATLPIPDGASVGSLTEALAAGRRLGPRTLLKPRNTGAGSGPVRLCQSLEQLEQRVREAAARGATEWIIERYLDCRLVRVSVNQGAAAGALAQSWLALCEQAAAKLGLANALVDLLVTADDDALVSQVSPQLSEVGAGGARVQQAPHEAVAAAGCIPVIAVTGTNGKTTTTRMIAHVARNTGQRTGFTTTQGIFIDDQLIHAGDCTGYWSHRAVLNHPQVDVAVLETARGGLLKRGLAFDRCTVGVMLNVSDDHLGLDGVDTVEQLAAVKALVAAAGDTAVLNADDAHCVAAGARMQRDEGIVYFAMSGQNQVVQAHLAAGHAAVFLHDEHIVRAAGREAVTVMDARTIPATMAGAARFNIANALAAVAALHAAGYADAAIRDGLASFVSDAQTNPLRANVFHVGEIRILLDYAHNSAAYAALGTMARGLVRDGSRVLAVVTSPGDRRDADLLGIGATCAHAFDQLFVYESASRGRSHGAAAALIAQGAGSSPGMRTYLSARQALQDAWRACRPGDVFVFACGTSVHTLIDALAEVDQSAAHSVACQAGIETLHREQQTG
ncbi:MAG TPA: Mur ligase family protein [Telluria sp.]|jgi:cyanophycin synthetase